MKFLSRGISRSVTVDGIDVSPETLWSTILDIEAMPIYLSDLKHVRIINDQHASTVHRREDISRDIPRDLQPTKEEDSSSASTSDRIREGFAWEELRFHPLLNKDMKNFKRVTRIGYHSISTTGRDCYDSGSGSVTNKKNRNNTDDFDCKSMNKQKQQHQKYIGIHATSFDDSDFRFRDATKTYTIFMEWEDVIATSHSSCSNESNRTSITATTTTSPSIQQLSSTSSSSYQLIPSKCRINVTTAFLTYNLCFLMRLKLYQFCGRTRLLDDYLRKEINEIIAEALRREHELRSKK